jgi:predicted MFS family arabinose efflux permease
VVVLVATPALVSPQALLWAAAGVFGAGFGLNSPITIDMLAYFTEADDRGLVMGMRVASNRLAQVVQPLLFGGVAGALGMTAGFLAAGVVMGSALIWASVKARQYVDD